MNRKEFLKGCMLGAAYLATSKLSFVTSVMQPLINDGSKEVGDIIITVFLRGGCGGVSMKIKDSGRLKGLEIKNSYTEEQFYLHCNAPELKELYDGNELAFIHACGLNNGTRSHFVAQDLIERGIAKNGSTNTGWMARYLNQFDTSATIHGASLGGRMAESLHGCRNAVSISELSEFKLAETINDHQLFKDWYGGDSHIDKTANKTLESIEYVRRNLNKYSNTRIYPSGVQYEELNNSFQNLAALIKMNAGINAATIDFSGWDHHENQGAHFPKLVKTLSRSLNAFYKDIAQHKKRLTIIVMSEFGRRLKSNASSGTDHGYGGLMMVLGGNVNGGKMYGQWPGLEDGQLNRGVDLEITTDYRAVLAEIISQKDRKNTIFPDLGDFSKLNLMKATKVYNTSSNTIHGQH
jgi:uncharacterized protein (DUF1501 family)